CKRFPVWITLCVSNVGLTSAILLIVFSPVVSESPSSMFPDAHFAWWTLSNPGIVSIPLAFLVGAVVTLTAKPTEDPAKQSEMEVRSLTGIGAEGATQH